MRAKRCALVVAATLLLTFPGRLEASSITEYWNSCGGDNFVFCAAVAISVENNVGTVRLWNYSGLAGTNSNPASGLIQLSLYGDNPITIAGPIIPDPSGTQYGYSDAAGTLLGGTRVTTPAFQPNPPFTDGWLLYARGAAFPGNPVLSANPYSAGLAIGSACPGGWDSSQQSATRFWQTPCALPMLSNLGDPGWVYFTFTIATGTLTDLHNLRLDLNAYADNNASLMTLAHVSSVPEASSSVLVSLGLAAGYVLRRRRIARRN